MTRPITFRESRRHERAAIDLLNSQAFGQCKLAPQGPSIEYPASGAYIWDHCHPLPCLSDALDVLGKNREASQLKNSANTPTRPTPSGTVKSIVPKQ